MGAVSDWINMDSLTRMRVWFLAIGVAILGTQAMHLSGMIDLRESIYLNTNFTWLGHILGGFIFGVGMTMASGCGQRTLVRLGGGNLKSLVVFLVMGITAYATLRGLFALIRLEINGPTTVDLTETGLTTQGLPGLLGYLTGISAELAGFICVVVIAGGAIAFSLRDSEVWKQFDNLLAGIGIGLIIVGAWYTTGVLGYDDFDPLQLEAASFIAPVGNSISYVMTYTGSSINFGIAVVFGLVAGAFLYSIVSGTFRLESFSDKNDFINHFIGAIMMGFGGVLGLGCTIGQGVSGVSTLAIGSIITLIFIITGSVFALKMQYYLYDDLGWKYALKSTLRDAIPHARD
ncbi:MAG: YeeE/YedE family protein [Gammaproteobacteria bacterium]|nr:YeeE/YedE family protein [Gammaproteobacteria bacterium]